MNYLKAVWERPAYFLNPVYQMQASNLLIAAECGAVGAIAAGLGSSAVVLVAARITDTIVGTIKNNMIATAITLGASKVIELFNVRRAATEEDIDIAKHKAIIEKDVGVSAVILATFAGLETVGAATAGIVSMVFATKKVVTLNNADKEKIQEFTECVKKIPSMLLTLLAEHKTAIAVGALAVTGSGIGSTKLMGTNTIALEMAATALMVGSFWFIPKNAKITSNELNEQEHRAILVHRPNGVTREQQILALRQKEAQLSVIAQSVNREAMIVAKLGIGLAVAAGGLAGMVGVPNASIEGAGTAFTTATAVAGAVVAMISGISQTVLGIEVSKLALDATNTIPLPRSIQAPGNTEPFDAVFAAAGITIAGWVVELFAHVVAPSELLTEGVTYGRMLGRYSVITAIVIAAVKQQLRAQEHASSRTANIPNM